MPSIDDVYGSGQVLKGSDLPAGMQVPVTIETAAFRDFDDGNKIALTFAGKEKGLIVNKTNAGRIAEMHGKDYEHWPGKLIHLQQDVALYKGENMLCVRVVPKAIMAAAPPPPPLAPQPPQQPLLPDEIPF